MRTILLLALFVLLATQLASPISALAQAAPSHMVMGWVLVDDAMPPPGTEVIALDGEKKLGAALVAPGGSFRIVVAPPPSGGPVTFVVGGIQANEQFTGWPAGPRAHPYTYPFYLTATSPQSGAQPERPAIGPIPAEWQISAEQFISQHLGSCYPPCHGPMVRGSPGPYPPEDSYGALLLQVFVFSSMVFAVLALLFTSPRSR